MIANNEDEPPLEELDIEAFTAANPHDKIPSVSKPGTSTGF